MAQKKKSGSKSAGVIATVVVLIIIVAGFFYIEGRSSSGGGGGGGGGSGYTTTVPQVHTITVSSQGTVFSVNPGSSYGYNFTVPEGAYSISLTGSYSSQGKIEVAILTPAQYGAFTQNPSSISSSQYYYGDTGGATVDTSLSAGQYTLVFYDPGVFTQDTVTIVNPMTLTYTS